MSSQYHYERANAELAEAEGTDRAEHSNNMALLACAHYLRAITEMLGSKLNAMDKGEDNAN